MKGVVVLLLLLIIPLALATHIQMQPAPGAPGAKIIFVDKGREYIKTPYGQSFIRKGVDNRQSRYRAETYPLEGQFGVVEKASDPISFKAPEGYFGYGIPKPSPIKTDNSIFRDFKLIYGIDTQIIKQYRRGRN
ncbi:MAG: hypothetical protein AABX70_05130 [Nanoarchaeota archaeon]